MSNEHSIDATQIHHNWDNSREPVLVVEPGDVVHFELPMTGDGQVTESSTVDEVTWNFDTIYNLGGPVFVQGAQQGDTLEVEILELEPGPWGWTTVIPELGLLPDDFPDPYLKIFDLRNRATATVAPASRCPLIRSWGRWESTPTSRASSRRFLPTREEATSTTDTLSSARRCGFRCGARARSSPAATLTLPRETERSASPGSNARCAQRFDSACGSAHCRHPRSEHPGR